MKRAYLMLAIAWIFALILGINSYNSGETPSWLSYFAMVVCLIIDNICDSFRDD